MITLTLAAPDNDALLAAGFTAIVVSKSLSGTSLGPFAAVGNPLPLVAGTLSYTYVDPAGGQGDWYSTQYSVGGTLSSFSPPMPAYLSTLLQAVRDLLGVTTVEASDTVILSPMYLPSALARVRGRLATFDTLVTLGGDAGALCLAALTHYTAALLCSRMIMLVMDMEMFKDYRYQRNRSLDWNATAGDLMEQYEEYISLAAGETAANTLMYVPGMLLAGPTASGVNTSGLVSFNPDLGEENPLVPYSVNPPGT